jgi:hypothetical protein
VSYIEGADDGRRIFTAEFKRGVLQQIVKGEKTRSVYGEGS